MLVPDDEQDILKVIIQSALRKYGHDVDAFADPISALGHFQKNYHDYEICYLSA